MTPNQTAKWALITVTAFAVISDTMLLPFYPHYFETVFGVSDPRVTSRYLAVSCLIVILTLPLWARIARQFGTLPVLMISQLAALFASLTCASAETLNTLLLLGWLMVLFKASYLLVYPYLLTLESSSKQAHTVGLLSVVVHLGAIVGALFGGSILQLSDPTHAFVWMAVGDGLQTLVCGWLIWRVRPTPEPTPATSVSANPVWSLAKGQLALVMWLFYFSAYLIRPFFVEYWHQLSPDSSEVGAAAIFAIPAAIAIAALLLERSPQQPPWLVALGRIPAALLIGALGFMLQAQPEGHWVIAGRLLYGWALFHATVKLDLKIFALSRAEDYGRDFSLLHLFQSLGVLVGAYAAGELLLSLGHQATFLIAGAGFLLTMLLFKRWFITPLPTNLKESHCDHR
ncbi:MFS transporter [Ferrimonas aestuarii]|uniref:MFS transporter n=1 Tax=Ferrimonas aestuarii TaxID=2569539 RepID=UPI00145D6D8D|nr:MFS transporter [Ferrimonas aestuarii]